MSGRTTLGRKRPDEKEPTTVEAGSGSDEAPGFGPFRVVPAGFADPAVIGVAVVTAAYLSVFFEATDIVGGTGRTAAAVAATGLAGAALARFVAERVAVRLTGALFAATLAGYYLAIPASRRSVFSVESVVLDVIALLTGLSVLRLALADVWILAVAPVPTFLVAYLAGRRRHVPAAAVAGGTLCFLALTGDAGGAATLAGIVGVALATGLSTLSAAGDLRSHGTTLGAVLVAMILVSATVTVLPAGAAQPWALDRGTPALESTLGADDELEIVGPTRLSQEVRYTIESPVAANWHANSYDTYTGSGWVRSGEQSALDGPLEGPSGETTTVNVSIEPEAETRALPSPWQAVDVSGAGSATAQVDDRGTIRLGAAVSEGDQTNVESRVLDAEPTELRNASEEYDPAIADRYTQLPESTPDRVGERTAAIVDEADADNPYDQAVAIERYLQTEYDYSLTVERPDGDVADAFLFEMDAGYCTYFATTMVAMLRSQGIPAQFVTGYTTGEEVSEDRYVVRGQNAHAWVKVYFPEHGWVEFDPTPSEERDQIRETRLADARTGGAENVDTEESETDAESEFDEPSESAAAAANGDESEARDVSEREQTGEPSVESISEGPQALEGPDSPERLTPEIDATRDGDEGGGLPIPSRDTAAYGLIAVVIGAAGARRLGVTARARRVGRLWVPWSRGTPAEDARRAFETMEAELGRRHRERRVGETPRAYLHALRQRGVDDRVHAVGETYERATYAETVTRERAAEARRTVRRFVLEGVPVIGRLLRKK